MEANGYILFQGPSKLDGAPIVVIATGTGRRSKNAKTGDMLQTYILRADMQPTDAVKTGNDSSICGACPHRGNGDGSGRTCYVNVGQGPLQVWRAWQRGSYPVATDIAALGAKRVVRLGSYGDPAAVPVNIWEQLTRDCVAHTGYTHQWNTAAGKPLRKLCMASADSVSEANTAWADGWRTFRVALPSHEAKVKGEVSCPASAEAGKKLQCAQCRACSGADGRRGSIVIRAHGGIAVMANVLKKAA